jgi:YD repeat-containing protein
VGIRFCLLAREQGGGVAIVTAYNTASGIVTYTDENGSVFSTTWDPMGRKINTTVAPASGIGGTTAQSFRYNCLAQTTFARDTANGSNADVTLVYDSIGRAVEEAQVFGGNARYVTNTAFASAPATQFTYPNARQIRTGFDLLYRKQQVIEQATSSVIAEQAGLNTCALSCAGPCGINDPGTILQIINDLQIRINYGYKKCCGSA